MITPVLFPVPIDDRSPVSKESCSSAMLGKELILGALIGRRSQQRMSFRMPTR